MLVAWCFQYANQDVAGAVLLGVEALVFRALPRKLDFEVVLWQSSDTAPSLRDSHPSSHRYAPATNALQPIVGNPTRLRDSAEERERKWDTGCVRTPGNLPAATMTAHRELDHLAANH